MSKSYFASSSTKDKTFSKLNEYSFTQKLTGILYAYKKRSDSTFVFIGQTIQLLPNRNYHQQYHSKTTLENHNALSVFTGPFVLKSKNFQETGKILDDVEERCKEQCCFWMNEQEKHFIHKHKTYYLEGGLNMSRGGQNITEDYSSHLENLKIRNERLETETMHPSCTSIWPIPSQTKVIGKLFNYMRKHKKYHRFF